MPYYSGDEAGLDIPLDVVELIMQELARKKDLETLKACALASRSFRSTCQQHIFATVKLDFSKQLTPQFWRLLQQTPAIGGYVRNLGYIDAVNNNSTSGAPILGQLHLVNSFKFGFKDSNSGPREQDWEEMNKSLRTSLCRFIHANNIVELYLFNIKNLPMSFLLHFPALSSLNVHQVRIADSPLPITFPSQEVIPRLSSLFVQFGSLITLRKLLGSGKVASRSILDLTQLNELSVQAEEPGAMELIKCILKTTENIKIMTLQGKVCFIRPSLPSFNFLSLGSYPDLDCLGNIASVLGSRSLKTLKTIRLYTTLESGDQDPYLHLTKEFEVIAGQNFLEQIIINIEVEMGETCTTDPSKWAQLDGVLSTANGFPFLRCVEVKIVIPYCCRIDHVNEKFVEEIRAVGESGFSWLVAAKQIEFAFDVRLENIYRRY